MTMAAAKKKATKKSADKSALMAVELISTLKDDRDYYKSRVSDLEEQIVKLKSERDHAEALLDPAGQSPDGWHHFATRICQRMVDLMRDHQLNGSIASADKIVGMLLFQMREWDKENEAKYRRERVNQ